MQDHDEPFVRAQRAGNSPGESLRASTEEAKVLSVTFGG
jgi:hypothetical protein